MTTEKKSKLVFCLLAAVAGLIIVIVFILVGAWQVGSGKDKQLENLWAQSIEYNQSRVDAWNDYLELKDKYDFLLENELANYFEAYQRGVAYAVSNIRVPKVIIKTITENITITNTEYIDRLVTRTYWQEFESATVLMEWCQSHLAELWPVGAINTDCDDYAERLQTEAYKDGYKLSCQLVENGKIFGKNVSNFLIPHMGNLAMIGNEIWFVEPQPDYFRVVYICDRDKGGTSQWMNKVMEIITNHINEK